ncbi:MAG: serpin family protein, partial [Candidatus Bipolaricaulota bacterium]
IRAWVVLLLGLAVVGCTSVPGTETDPPDIVASDIARDRTPALDPGALDQLVYGNTGFAFDLYGTLRDRDGNLLFSPLSISIALAMTSAGARGTTLAEMESTLHFELEQAALHPAFNALDLELASRAQLPEGWEGDGFSLNVVNSTWMQTGHPFLEGFLDVLGENYGSGIRLVDYRSDPEAARLAINAWVEDQTEGRIEELIPAGMIASDSRLTLVNAIYFLAPWASPFPGEHTEEAPFHLRDGTVVDVPTMHLTELQSYAAGTDYQAVELAYNGHQLAMTIILPDEGAFATVEEAFSPALVEEIVAALSVRNVSLALPRFRFEWGEELSGILASLGMPSAFGPGIADFSEMDGSRDLYIGFVMHKAFISVFEEGTEAAAATAVGMRAIGIPEEPLELRVDRPFLFLIRDVETGTILFAGRVLDPSS